MRAAILLVLIAARVASAAPATLTVLAAPDSELHAMRVDAIRAEAAVRGLRVEVLATAGSDALAAALLQRSDVAAVLWSEGSTLWVRTPDGRVAHAPLVGAENSPRVVAAIASSLIDDLVGVMTPAVRVDVDVHIGEPVAPTAVAVVAGSVAPGTIAPVVAGTEREPRQPPWYLDVGGLAAPGDIYEAHLGLGRYVTEAIRGAMIGHAVKVPGGVVAAATLELSHTWGRRVRTEAGGRAIGSVTFHDDIDCDSGVCMQTWSKHPAFGVGGFLGIGVRASWGTIYARAGLDFVGSNLDPVTPTPNGALGVELPL